MPSHSTPRNKYVAPDYFCAACRARGKTWNGDDPTCAFQHGKPFSSNNWSCATLDLIRDLIPRYHEPAREGIKVEWHDDQTYATILIDTDYRALEDISSWCLWMTWYKSRGRTEQLWLMPRYPEEDGPPRPPTEAEVLAIAKHYGLYDKPLPMTPERAARIAEWEGVRAAMMAGFVEIAPGVHMLELGGESDDDIPF